jgi:hypothetical protein
MKSMMMIHRYYAGAAGEQSAAQVGLKMVSSTAPTKAPVLTSMVLIALGRIDDQVAARLERHLVLSRGTF